MSEMDFVCLNFLCPQHQGGQSMSMSELISGLTNFLDPKFLRPSVFGTQDCWDQKEFWIHNLCVHTI